MTESIKETAEVISSCFAQISESARTSDITIIVLSHNSTVAKIQKSLTQTPFHEVNDIPLFKYIHPSVTDDEERRKINREIENLVQNLPLNEICKYLRQMYKEKRVYLNVKLEAMFDELQRLGMPDENTQGFSYKTFQNCFNINN